MLTYTVAPFLTREPLSSSVSNHNVVSTFWTSNQITSSSDSCPLVIQNKTGHLHLLLFSVCAAVAPLSFQDKIYLEKGEEHEAASGLFPKYKHGLTPEAEIFNGRLAMLGLTVLLASSITTQQPILDTINKGLGGFLF